MKARIIHENGAITEVSNIEKIIFIEGECSVATVSGLSIRDRSSGVCCNDVYDSKPRENKPELLREKTYKRADTEDPFAAFKRSAGPD